MSTTQEVYIMHDLMAFQLRRLFRKTSFYICILLSVLPYLYIMLNLVVSMVTNSTAFGTVNANEWFIISDIVSTVTILMAVFTSLFICEDHTNGTAKIIYSKGYSRTELFLSKYLVSTISAALFFLSVMIVPVILSFVVRVNYNTEFYFFTLKLSGPGWVVLYLLKNLTGLLALNSFFYMVSEYFRKTGISMIINLIGPNVSLTIILSISTMLESLLYESTGNTPSFINETVSMKIAAYWLPGLVSSLADIISQNYDYGIGIIINTGYITLFSFLSYLVSRKIQIS